MIRMSHPDLPGQVITVPEEARNGHLRSGWVIDTTPPPPEDLAVEVTEIEAAEPDEAVEPDEVDEPDEDTTSRPAVERRSEHTPVAGKE